MDPMGQVQAVGCCFSPAQALDPPWGSGMQPGAQCELDHKP